MHNILFENKDWLCNANEELENKTAQQRIEFVLQHLPRNYAMASSFGAQSAVSLHLLNQVVPNIPVILVDTGYLFPETYQFIDKLTEKLQLNLHVYRAELSSAWQEARYGKLWTQGAEQLKQYNQRNKVEPMERALEQLTVGTWFAGLRRQQASSRSQLPVVQSFKNRIKVHPIIDWDNRMLHQYLKNNSLPYHPLWEKGYISIGDTHSTVPLSVGMREEDTRFAGMQRECGLHVDTLSGF
ncbi:MAG: phosphoadenylyl-sulfate reductase [Kangiellaceae bacterium]|nr:phosphoadenylyl-sulfate reductase [Kangiellaceae bacterium]